MTKFLLKIKDLPLYVKILIALTLLSFCAQITIPMPLIPITLQSLAVLLIGYFMRPDHTLIVTLLYLLLGGLGFPIFADGEAGIAKLYGPSAGYLFGFVGAAYMVSILKDNLKNPFLIMLIGTFLIIIPGISYLAYMKDWNIAWQYGFLPIWKGAIIKILLGGMIVLWTKKYILEAKNILD